MESLIVFLTVIFVIVCVIMVLLILMQGGKSEGLFASSQANVLGGRGGDVLSKTTSVLATIFFIGAMVISFLISLDGSESAADKVNKELRESQPVPEAGTEAPAGTEEETEEPAEDPSAGSLNPEALDIAPGDLEQPE